MSFWRLSALAFDPQDDVDGGGMDGGGTDLALSRPHDDAKKMIGNGDAMKISVDTTIGAPIGDVWCAYTTPDDIEQWNAASDDWHTTAASVDLRVGGSFSSRMESKDGSMGFDFAGTYTNIVENELIEYSFGDRKAKVEFVEGTEGVKVTVTFDVDTSHTEAQQRQGWQAILHNFKRHVEEKAR